MALSDKPYCVYLISCRANGKGYVGAGESPEPGKPPSTLKRWAQHKNDAFSTSKEKNRRDRFFMRAIRKYGRDAAHVDDAFDVEILEFCDTRERALGPKGREVYWIDRLGTFRDRRLGYNMTAGGEGTSGRTREHMGEEEFERRCAASRAMARRPEFLAACSAASRRGWSDSERAERHRASLRAARLRPEVCAKLRVAAEANRDVRSEGQRNVWARPGFREKRSAVDARPDVKERKSAAALASWTKNGARERRAAAMRAAHARKRSSLLRLKLVLLAILTRHDGQDDLDDIDGAMVVE